MDASNPCVTTCKIINNFRLGNKIAQKIRYPPDQFNEYFVSSLNFMNSNTDFALDVRYSQIPVDLKFRLT